MLSAATVLLLATACSSGDNESVSASPSSVSSSPGSSTVTSTLTAGVGLITMENFAFSPANPQVRPGEKITVVNKDSAAHTVTATEGNAFDTGSIPGGKSETFTAPSKTGEYAFVCTFHPT